MFVYPCLLLRLHVQYERTTCSSMLCSNRKTPVPTVRSGRITATMKTFCGSAIRKWEISSSFTIPLLQAFSRWTRMQWRNASQNSSWLGSQFQRKTQRKSMPLLPTCCRLQSTTLTTISFYYIKVTFAWLFGLQQAWIESARWQIQSGSPITQMTTCKVFVVGVP